jgi:hypothetical protein
MNGPIHHHRQYATGDEVGVLRSRVKELEHRLAALEKKLTEAGTLPRDLEGDMPQSKLAEPTGEMAELIDNHGPAYP